MANRCKDPTTIVASRSDRDACSTDEVAFQSSRDINLQIGDAIRDELKKHGQKSTGKVARNLNELSTEYQ